MRINPDDLATLGLQPPKRFAVPANTLVAIDTSGFHARGSSDRPAVRVEIWAFSRRTPFLPWATAGLLSWKPVADRRAEWMTWIVDRLDRLGLKQQHWRPAGRR